MKDIVATTILRVLARFVLKKNGGCVKFVVGDERDSFRMDSARCLVSFFFICETREGIRG